MKKTVITSIILLLCYCAVYAQISTREIPAGFKYDFGKEQMPVMVMPDIDLIKLQVEDEEEEQLGIPPRFGFIHSVTISLLDAGDWHTLENGDKLCQLTIVCPNALSINLLYDKFWLPEGAKFFIYSQNKRHHIGAFTDFNNKGTRDEIEGFATGLVYGNTIILEYYLPENCTEKGIISISGIVHGYRYIMPEYGYGDVPQDPRPHIGFNQSGDCQVNINCPEGNNWQNEKRAVALILVNGNRTCTGALINNTNNDNYPYFLTAHHCLGDNYDAISNPNLNHWTFYWNYELPPNSNDCNYNNSTPSEPLAFSTSGAKVLANNYRTDFALLKLDEDPIYFSNYTPPYIPYYLGWDRTGNPGTGGVGIHHPCGDVKKIATYNITPPNYTNCMQDISFPFFLSGSDFWKINWMVTPNGHSVTEGGSSGSPLINNNRYVIGQLYCPGACPTRYCSNPSESIGNYGKFSVSWTDNGSTDNRRKLQPWLDSFGVGATVLDGMSIFPCSPPLMSYLVFTTNITSNTVWSSNVMVHGVVTIKSNATLTIQNTTVALTSESSIIINPGGKLVINGGTLTAACPDKMWKGITVLGFMSLPQTPQHQGTVELKNNAIIEHALCAISAAPASYSNAGGGIITATSATFRNNLRAIECLSFKLYHTSFHF